MGGSTLCVSCVRLPLKERGAAAKSQRCPQCQADIGVTAYGTCFRIPPRKQRLRMSPSFLFGTALGAGLFSFTLVMVGLGTWMSEQVVRPTRPAEPPAPTQLAQVREVSLDDPFPADIQPMIAKQRLTQRIAQIKSKNLEKQDAFMAARIQERKQLQGLPFVMGHACRTTQARATAFHHAVEAVRHSMDRDSGRGHFGPSPDNQHSAFWLNYGAETQHQGTTSEHGIAALTQILAPERQSMRASLVQKLAATNRPEATKAIAKAAIFDSSGEIRMAAIDALKKRPREEYTDVLMNGLRYPMASVVNRSAVALVMLDRKDVLTDVAKVLGEPAPSDPAPAKIDDKDVCVVREMVRVNHHRNCLLCHSPTSTGNREEVPGVLPIPGMPFPSSPSEAYGAAVNTGDPMVRADTTYLRQDFSVLLPVANAVAWPVMQRFDFLVRTRIVDGKELEVLKGRIAQRGADFLSENQKAALHVLRELTGQNAEPTPAAWQRVIAPK